MTKIDNQRPDFEPNSALPDGTPSSLLLPSVPIDRMDELPSGIKTAGDYVRVFEGSYRDLTVAGVNAEYEVAKASPSKMPPTGMAYGNIAFMPDPQSSGVIEWPGIQPAALKKIVKENIAPQLIIGMRCADVNRYSQLSTHMWKPGWGVEIMDTSRAPDEQERKDILEAQVFLANSCVGIPLDKPQERDQAKLLSFENFLDAATRDTLTYASIALWTNTDSNGKVISYALLPAGNIRLTGRTMQNGQFVLGGWQDDPNIFAVLVNETKTVIAAFTHEELTFYVRNPRTDIDVFGYGYCYDSDTEVLTKSGWKHFEDVDIAKDQFATINMKTEEFEWQIATHKTFMPYIGEMYSLRARSMDLLVTPNHRVVYYTQQSSEGLKVIEAKDLFNKPDAWRHANMKIPTTASWKGKRIGKKSFTCKYAKKPIELSGDDYCAFMGMYLAEGYVPNNINSKNAYICQIESSKGFYPFKDLLTRILGAEPYHVSGEFVVCRKALADHVTQFGRRAVDKHIPDEIMNAPPKQLALFWHYYLLGDGRLQDIPKSSDRRGALGGIHYSISTSSRKMADQLQELAVKMGYSAKISRANRAGMQAFDVLGEVRKDGTRAHNVYNCAVQESYSVLLRGSRGHSFKMEKTTYSGNIGCVTVPNGTLYVRRNGTPAWSGNSEVEIAIRLVQGYQNALDLNLDTFNRSAIPNGILVLSGGQVTQKQLDLLNRMWTNLKKGVTKSWALPVMGLSEGAKIEVLDLSRMKGNEAFFKEFLNMLAGALATVYKFPVNRLGYRISGDGKDTAPAKDSGTVESDADDPGLAPLLNHLEGLINQYILWSRWPHLRFTFYGKSPRESAREYEHRRNAMTLKEARAEAGLKPLSEIEGLTEEAKFIANIMDGCPLDSGLAGVYQTLAAVAATAKFNPGGKDPATPGARMDSKQDPAKAETHGHTSGVRRDSASE